MLPSQDVLTPLHVISLHGWSRHLRGCGRWLRCRSGCWRGCGRRLHGRSSCWCVRRHSRGSRCGSGTRLIGTSGQEYGEEYRSGAQPTHDGHWHCHSPVCGMKYDATITPVLPFLWRFRKVRLYLTPAADAPLPVRVVADRVPPIDGLFDSRFIRLGGRTSGRIRTNGPKHDSLVKTRFEEVPAL